MCTVVRKFINQISAQAYVHTNVYKHKYTHINIRLVVKIFISNDHMLLIEFQKSLNDFLILIVQI